MKILIIHVLITAIFSSWTTFYTMNWFLKDINKKIMPKKENK